MQPQKLFKKYRHLFHHRHLWLPVGLAALIAAWLVFHPTATTWEPAGLAVEIPVGQTTAEYTSPEVEAATFNAFLIRFWQTGVGEATVETRFETDAGWSEWQAVVPENEGDVSDEAVQLDTFSLPTNFWSGMALTEPAEGYQFRLHLVGSAGYRVDRFELSTPDLSHGSPLSFFNHFVPRATAQITDLAVKSRTDWGANPAYLLHQPRRDDKPTSSDTTVDGEKPTSLRDQLCQTWQRDHPEEFKNDGRSFGTDLDGNKLAWPRTYSESIKKIVIHHTASQNRDMNGDGTFDAKDAEIIVRAIYYSHAVNNGWGDIGYNYLIDPFGNLYEGRSGGEKVIGAHVYCANTGTIGISFVGNFEEGEPSAAALAAAGKLVGELGNLHGLDLAAESEWHGKVTSAVVGHRDYGYTSCPGKYLYAKLSDIRTSSRTYAEAHRPSGRDYDYRSPTATPTTRIAPLASGAITITLENNGKKPWPAGTRFVLPQSELISNRVGVLANRGDVLLARLDRELGVGGVQTLTIPLTTALQAGRYTFTITPQFGSSEGRKLPFAVEVGQPILNYEVVSAKHPPRPLPLGEPAEAVIELRNTSSFTWYASGANRMYMAAIKPTGRKSVFTDSNELGQLVADTPPGGVGRFVMKLTAPTQAKRYIEPFAPAVKDSITLPDYGMYFDILVREPRFSADIVKKSGGDELKLLPGEKKELFVELKNTSQLTWKPDQFRLVVVKSRGGVTFDGGAARITREVKFGETVRVPLAVTAGVRAGKALLSLRPQWTSGESQVIAPIDFALEVLKPELRATLLEKPAPLSLTVGDTQTITIAYKNTGTVVWQRTGDNAVRLGTYQPQDRTSAIYDASWPAPTRAAALVETAVRPGEIGHFTLTIKKTKSGRQDEVFAPVMEGVSWMTQEPVKLTVIAARTTAVHPSVDVSAVAESTQAVALATHKTAITQTAAQSAEPHVRIRLSFPHDRADIGGGWFTLTDDAGTQLFRGQFASIWWDKIKDGKVYRFVPDEGVILTVTNWRHHPGWSKTVNDNRYRGVLEVRAVDGKLVLINDLPLESYIRGIAEPLPTDPSEKVKLLAILARSYAAYYTDPSHRKFPGKPYDGSDNPAEFQKYLGYSYELRGNMPSAAESTRGQVVTYDGRVMKTPYFTSSNGITKTARDAKWVVADFPFTKSVEDPWSCGGTSADIGKKLSCPDKARGHSVGISGMGMTGLANEGKSVNDILTYFYTGVKVEKKW